MDTTRMYSGLYSWNIAASIICLSICSLQIQMYKQESNMTIAWGYYAPKISPHCSYGIAGGAGRNTSKKSVYEISFIRAVSYTFYLFGSLVFYIFGSAGKPLQYCRRSLIKQTYVSRLQLCTLIQSQVFSSPFNTYH